MPTIKPTPYQPVKSTRFPDENVLLLQKAHFAGVAPIPGKIVLSFEFCFFRKLIIKNDEPLDFNDASISFTNCFIAELEVHQIADEAVSISLSSCIFSGRLTASKLASFQVNNCLIRQGLFMTNLPNIRISYTTENIFPYWWNQLFKELRYGFDWFTEDDHRYHIENPVKLVITSSRKDSDKRGYYLIDFNTIKIYRLGYRLSERRENRIKASVFVNYDEEKDETTLIENVQLKSLSLTGNPKGKIAVERVKVTSLYLSEFSPKDEAGFYDISPKTSDDEETKIGIHKCNLDQAWFDNVDFERFQRLSFYRSKFSRAVFTSCNFPDAYEKFAHFLPIANIHYPDDRTKNEAKDMYEIFLQLKKAMDATGNSYESLKMQAVSQSALRHIKSISIGDKFILGTSDLSNEHGQSIGRPFWWFLGISIAGYLLYLSSLGLLFQRTAFDPNLIGYYFSFLDITHRTDFLVEKKELTGWSLAVDYLVKVLLSYLIVQFVTAFRKYGRK